MGSGGRVLSCASEAYFLAQLKASQRYLALGKLRDVCMQVSVRLGMSDWGMRWVRVG